MELMIIGIDAMDPRIIFDNIDIFPNMKKLCEEGCYSSYDSYVYGYGSFDNWISLYTGLSPKQHGIINNINIVNNEEPEYKYYKEKKPFWKVLGDRDISVAVWRGPATSPAEIINGYMISGQVNYNFNNSNVKYESIFPKCHKDDMNISRLLTEENIGYPEAPKKPSDYGLKWKDLFEDNSLFEDIIKGDNYFEDGYLYLDKELKYYRENILNTQKKYPTDVMFYYTPTLDLIQHFQSYDPNRRIVIESMKLIDKFIGQLIEKISPDNVVILSDHGISSIKEVLGNGDINIQKEAFGWSDKSIWLKNGEIVTEARNGGILSGLHDIKGTFIMAGRDIKKNEIKEMRTLDFYPTLLELFGIEVPKDREGYVLDIFKDKNIINKSKLLNKEMINYKKIIMIQNMGVAEFNTVINEVFLDYRFHEITLYCEHKYKSVFDVNPRLKEVQSIDSLILDIDVLEGYNLLCIGYKNDSTGEVKYIKINL